MFDLSYISAQEIRKTRDIFKIFTKQKKMLVDVLESLGEKSLKSADPIDEWESETRPYVGDYLFVALKPLMLQASKPTIEQYNKYLPEGYTIRFDLPTDPARKYLDKLRRLHLSNYQGSISATTNDEIRDIIAQGLSDGLSYNAIAKNIKTQDLFVFSRARANLIAITEVGRAYGFAHFEPAIEMQKMGYTMEKLWITSHDGQVRSTHSYNESLSWIPLEKKFPNGDDFAPSVMDIRCRCHHITRIV